MWERGEYKGFSYCAKVYDEPSQFGIDGGRVSKLEVRKDGKTILNYDRGWDVKPSGDMLSLCMEIVSLYR